ncbi:CDK-activating kinase assembly factor MAT1 protein [Cardiosporidium cionae]|uniref:CDK-activating kinase assembly factor MAT1 protein n=1 Tax=Cardiosporidium cionae TaxID=476202 RepID=A0ABQ7JF54_9APIC|nr:CDK-activating kinase assembly factor MAT1 protein [Cardiosporidium cionae]|eukprot:KAF8822628.1 CDK-activating kinase assembly factor MAT1 protein [Cardiosporidium cionae]
MESFECPVCLESIYYLIDRRMLYSELCNHKFSPLRDNQRMHFMNKVFMCMPTVGQLGRGQCPQCRQPVTKANFKEKDPEGELLAAEKEARRHISAVYNDSRLNFENTPAYNDYLEMKESMVYELALGTDDTKKRSIESTLRNHERRNAKQIAENADARREMQKTVIRNIVESEGTFYEAIKQNLMLKPAESHQILVHPLQRQYAALFKTESNNFAVQAVVDIFPKPLDALIKEEDDIPRKALKTKEQKNKAELAGGYDRLAVSQRNLAELRLCLLIGLS